MPGGGQLRFPETIRGGDIDFLPFVIGRGERGGGG